MDDGTGTTRGAFRRGSEHRGSSRETRKTPWVVQRNARTPWVVQRNEGKHRRSSCTTSGREMSMDAPVIDNDVNLTRMDEGEVTNRRQPHQMTEGGGDGTGTVYVSHRDRKPARQHSRTPTFSH